MAGENCSSASHPGNSRRVNAGNRNCQFASQANRLRYQIRTLPPSRRAGQEDKALARLPALRER
jgi:hypothetical protein